jgi:hypothetical protein
VRYFLEIEVIGDVSLDILRNHVSPDTNVANERRYVREMVYGAPTWFARGLTYERAVGELDRFWSIGDRITRKQNPKIQIRPTFPLVDAHPEARFDLFLQRLPDEFWTQWGLVYKGSVSALLGLSIQEAATRCRQLPLVVFKKVGSDELEHAVRRIRIAFNYSRYRLADDAIVIVPHSG